MANKKRRHLDAGEGKAAPSAPAPAAMAPESWRRASWAILGLLALLFAASVRSYYVGYFNDDAFYVIGAKSLLAGHYANLAEPGNPPLIQFMPGYPLLLAPLAWIFGNSALPFQIVSVCMTWAAFLLAYRLWKGDVPPAVRLGGLLLAGLSPVTATLSGAVMAEVPYFLVSTGLLCLLAKHWDRSDVRFWLCVGALAGYGGIIRPTGIALPLSLALSLACEKRWRTALMCIATGLLPISLFVLRNWLLTGIGTTYAQELAMPFAESPLRGLSILGRLMGHNALFYARTLFAEGLFNWPDIPGKPVLEWLAAGLGGAAMLTGIGRMWGRGWKMVAWLHAAIYMAGTLMYYKQSDRYLFPLLILLATAFVNGLAAWEPRAWTSVSQAVRAFFLLGFACTVNADRLNVAGAFAGPNSLNSPPPRTYQWIRQSTGPSDVFAGVLNARMFLYTGRKTLIIPLAGNGFELAAWATAKGVNHILVSGLDESTMSPAAELSIVQRQNSEVVDAMLSETPLFVKVFSDPAERSTIYRLVAPLFQAAPVAPGPTARLSGS